MRRISYILLLGILLSACQKNTKSKGTNLPVEVISPIKKTETGRSREYTFLSRPYNETVLSFRINGPVLNFDLRPGQAFSKGSTILLIDNRDFLIRKQQTNSQRNIKGIKACVSLTRKKNGSRPFTKRITSPEVTTKERKRISLSPNPITRPPSTP